MKKYIAEFIGTVALVFCGTGAVIVNQQTESSLGLLGIATTFGIIIGLIVTGMILFAGPISGGSFIQQEAWFLLSSLEI